MFTVHQACRKSCHKLPNYSVIFACRLALKNSDINTYVCKHTRLKILSLTPRYGNVHK